MLFHNQQTIAESEPKSSKTAYVALEVFFWHEQGHHTIWEPSGIRAIYPQNANLPPALTLLQPDQHIESPESKRRLHNILQLSGLAQRLHSVPVRKATVEELTRVHTLEYVQYIASKNETGGNGGEAAPFGVAGFDIASYAAGAGIAAVEAVCDDQAYPAIKNAYALLRPPGHHAERDRGMGFCIFNNIAIAAQHALLKFPELIKRIAIVDFDVHHGNGTQ